MASATCSSLIATHGGSHRWSKEDIAQVDALMLQAEENPIYMAERTGDRQRYLTEICQTPARPRLQASVDDALNHVVQVGWERINWNKGYNLLHYFAHRHKEPIALILVSYLAPPGEIEREDKNRMRPIDYAREAAAKDPAHQGVVDAVEAVRNRGRQQSLVSTMRLASPPPCMRRTASGSTSTTAGSPSGLHLSRSPSDISVEAIRNSRLKERIPSQQVIEQIRHCPDLNVQMGLRQRSCTPPAARHREARAASPANQELHPAPANRREARAASPAHQATQRVPRTPHIDLEALRQRSVTPPAIRHQERQGVAPIQQEYRLPSQSVAVGSPVALHHTQVSQAAATAHYTEVSAPAVTRAADSHYLEGSHARTRDAQSDEASRWANRRGATPASTPPSTPRSEVHAVFPDVQLEKQQRDLPPYGAHRPHQEEVVGPAIGRSVHRSASEALAVEALGRQVDKEVWQRFLCEATRSGCTFEGGFTILHLAAECRDITTARAGLEAYKQSDPRMSVLHQRDHKGRRPVDCANRDDLQMLDLLSPDSDRLPAAEVIERWRRGEHERGDERQVLRQQPDRGSTQSLSSSRRTQLGERALKETEVDHLDEPGVGQPLRRISWRSKASGSSSDSKAASQTRYNDASEPGATSLRPRNPDETAHFGGDRSRRISNGTDSGMSEHMSSENNEDEDNDLPGHFGRPMTFDPHGDK